MATNTPKSNLGEFYTNLTKTANNGMNSLMKSIRRDRLNKIFKVAKRKNIIDTITK